MESQKGRDRADKDSFGSIRNPEFHLQLEGCILLEDLGCFRSY